MSIWWILLIFIIIAISIAILLYAVYPRLTPSNNNINRQQTISGFNQVCTNTTICGSGLTCQPTNGNNTGICKQPLTGPCLTLNDCNTSGPNGANVCQITSTNPIGFCARTNVGNLNGACPCTSDSGLTCTSFPTGDVCKLSPGQECSLNSQCSVGICANGVCSIGKSIGQPCSTGQCVVGLSCSLGWCQTNGITTGNAGAYCEPPSDNLNIPGCNGGLSCINNSCQVSTNILGDVCSLDLACAPPLNCVYSNGQTTGTCYFPTSVNSCVSNTCIPNFTCNDMQSTSTQCLANKGQACNINGNCLSDNCGFLPSMYTWDTGNQWSVIPVMLPENLLVEWIQTRYISDTQIQVWITNEIGLYYGIYNRNTNVVGAWSLIIPRQSIKVTDQGSIVQTLINRSLFVDSTGLLWIGVRNQTTMSWDGLYQIIIQLDGSGMLQPYNTTSGQLEGQQFYNGQGIIISSVSISINQDILLTGLVLSNIQSVLYIKEVAQLVYNLGPDGYQGQFVMPSTNTTTTPVENYSYITRDRQYIKFFGQLSNIRYPQELPGSSAPVQTYDVITYNFFQSNDTPLTGPMWILADITSGGTGTIMFSVENNVQYAHPGYFGPSSVMSALPATSSVGPTSTRNILAISGLQCTI